MEVNTVRQNLRLKDTKIYNILLEDANKNKDVTFNKYLKGSMRLSKACVVAKLRLL